MGNSQYPYVDKTYAYHLDMTADIQEATPILQEKGVTTLMAILTSTTHSTDIVEKGAGCLANIAIKDVIKEEVYQQRGILHIVKCLSSRSKGVQLETIRAISFLAQNRKYL
jgi:hypothetical protein